MGSSRIVGPAVHHRAEHFTGGWWRVVRRILLPGLLAIALAAPGTPRAAAQDPVPRPTQLGPRDGLAFWQTEYTPFLELPSDEMPVVLAADLDALWLATGTTVARLSDGTWSAPEQPTDADQIYAMTVAAGDLWAVGWAGGAWHRERGTWHRRPSGTQGDLYAVEDDPLGGVWAAGFDYETATGVITHWDGDGNTATWSDPSLLAVHLYSVGVDAEGTPWVGGCRITGWEESEWTPVIFRREGEGWHEHNLPLATGCVYDISFAPDRADMGWAAAGTDLLRWQGEGWSAEGISPPAADPDASPEVPDGLEWVRVAATVGRLQQGEIRSTAWAVAGISTWRGYVSGQSPLHFDGSRWGPATVDFRGLAGTLTREDAEIDPRSFMALVSDGTTAWSVNRAVFGPGERAEAAATVMRLEDEVAHLVHPLVVVADSIRAHASGGNEGPVHVAGRRGRLPISRVGGVGWEADPGFRFTPPVRRAERVALDMPSSSEGWHLRVTRTLTRTFSTAHRFEGDRWTAATIPTSTRQLRGLPGGGAIARLITDNAGDAWYSGRLAVFDGDGWSALAGAPDPAPATRRCDRFDRRRSITPRPWDDCDVPRAPFDAVVADRETTAGSTSDGDGHGDEADAGRPADIPERLVGWIGGADNRFYRWSDGGFSAQGDVFPGPILDLELASPRAGWAIVHDPDGRNPTDRLARLRGGSWHLVDDLMLRHPVLRFGVTAVQWEHLSVVDEREVWLVGRAYGARATRSEPILVRLRDNRAVVYPLQSDRCVIRDISAIRLDDRIDVWLIGSVAPDLCGMDGWPHPVVATDGGISPERDRISRLRLPDDADRVVLPFVQR